MSNHFTPELGQMAFGHPWHAHAVPEIWNAALAMLGHEIDRVLWNRDQIPDRSPMSNSGERFDCSAFSAHAYSWGGDEQPWNFKWRDIEISWYKYLGRGMSANRALTPDEAADMLIECLAAVRAEEAPA